jgi:hypothetical protein
MAVFAGFDQLLSATDHIRIDRDQFPAFPTLATLCQA